MKKVIIALILVGALASYILRFEVPAVQQELVAHKIFGDLAPQEVESVQINNPNGQINLVNSKPEKPKVIDPSEGVSDSLDEVTKDLPTLTWSFSDLPQARLERASVEGVTQAVSGFSFTKKIDASDVEKDLSVYGLQEPEVVVTVRAKGEEYKIAFGDKNEFVGGRYAQRLNDGALFLVDDTLYQQALKTKESYRSKMPVSFGDASVKKVTLNDGKQSIVIEPQSDKSFKLTSPLVARAASFAVFDLYRGLRNLQAEAFHDSPEKLSDYGLDATSRTITIDRDTTPLTIMFGQKNGGHYFRISGQPTIYKAVGEPEAILFKDVITFRDGQQFMFDPYQAEAVRVYQDNREILSFKNANGAWEFADGTKADTPFVREYLKKLSSVKATAYQEPRDLSWATEPSIKVWVSLNGESGIKEKVLLVGRQTPQGYPAFVEDIKEVFFIDGESVKEITPAVEKFKIVPEPTHTPAAQATPG